MKAFSALLETVVWSVFLASRGAGADALVDTRRREDPEQGASTRIRPVGVNARKVMLGSARSSSPWRSRAPRRGSPKRVIGEEPGPHENSADFGRAKSSEAYKEATGVRLLACCCIHASASVQRHPSRGFGRAAAEHSNVHSNQAHAVWARLIPSSVHPREDTILRETVRSTALFGARTTTS